MGRMSVVVVRGLDGRGMIDVNGVRVMRLGDRSVMLIMRRSGVIVRMVIMGRRSGRVVVVGDGRGVVMVSGRLSSVAMSVIAVPMIVVGGGNRRVIVLALRGRGVVIMTMIFVRLVFVAHDSIPQPLCAVFSGEIGIT